MTKADLLKVNINSLGDNARRLFETSDIEALHDFFGSCSLEEIDNVADEIAGEYPDLFCDA